ncbi:branched-subunit amino acid aminotransferase/4-amino-4-deoxychorismate lyase [Kribbella amoyensis]|uniref:Branched-subunit amino acid aminotransferase/4-amino-4-deoxychorismate lyase n=1 Tax=Kribbella amoyensis TaxID=996641 RepID=A0A561BK22_9ACTN|nr:aminotransferase class IV [Kribbella amoyensis]TWD79193.1 branched-subunit amino acid aminotransferase/4-amino-4-deoxychorismate lyase [Kribbella amoyensis]
MPLLVADSFLVAQGNVRGLDRHRARFTASCAAAGADGAAEYWDDQVGRLPGFGRWFPRIELWSEPAGAPRYAVQVRPAPTPGDRVRVAVHRGADPRTSPRVKGPDLDVLGKVKADAAEATGADEVLLLDTDGVAVEAAYSALAWWEDEVLCFPPADRAFLPSVTAQLVRELAVDRGAKVEERARTAEQLAAEADEVWLLNALHGIRPVHAWDDGPIDPLPGSRSTEWRNDLLALARPV